jgi:hypothetical protein
MSTPMPPTATVGPNPTPAASIAHLHVLQHPWVMAYPIDPTGRLLPPVTQRVGNGIVALSGEPQGRFVLAGREVPAEGYYASTIVSYAPDSRDGTLVKRSESDVFERPVQYCYQGVDGSTCRETWVWLRAGASRVHGMWEMAYGPAGPSHYQYSYVSAALGPDGQLGKVSRLAFPTDFDRGLAAVDVRESVLYKTEPYLPAGNGALEAYVIEPDGSLTRIGTTHLCLARRFEDVAPLLTVRGFVFAEARIGSWWESPSVCTYQGLRLKPLEALDFGATRAEALVPEKQAEPALVAMNTQTSSGGTTQEHLRLLAMGDDGALEALDVEHLPGRSRQILFHPLGRALYVLDAASALHVYAVSARGELDLMMSIDHAGESMAITWH